MLEHGYQARHFARLLEMTSDTLARAEKKPPLAALAAAREPGAPYTLADLAAYRAALGVRPQAIGHRRQLFLNFKGGTGKTSLSTAYAWRLVELGYRVLVVDLDSQGHATKCLGLEGSDFEHTVFGALVHRAALADAIVAVAPGLDLVPANLSLATVDLSLMPLAAREYRLRQALKPVEGRYDAVILDAAPSFGLLSLNAIVAADDLFVPVLADFLSFHGLKLLFETVQGLEGDLQHTLDHICVVLNAYNATYRIAKEARDALESHYADYLMPVVVRQCTKFAQASSEGRPISAADPDSKGAEDVAAFTDAVVELLVRDAVGGGRRAAANAGANAGAANAQAQGSAVVEAAGVGATVSVGATAAARGARV